MNTYKNSRILSIISVLILSLAMIIVAGCQSDTATPAATTAPTATNEPEPTATEAAPDGATAAPTVELTETPVQEATFVADGWITENEYDYETTIGTVRIVWSSDGSYLYMALQAETEGWLAVGLDPVDRMEGANYIFAYVDDAGPTIDDQYGTEPTGRTHLSDVDLGGTNDLINYAAIELDGVTTLEFQIPLDSGDEYDKPLALGETYPIIVATGKSDDMESTHNFEGEGEIYINALTY